MQKLTFFFLTIVLSTVLLSCGNKNTIKPSDTIDVAFEKAKSLFDKKKYTDATRAFEIVLNIARGTQYARDAQYYLAESYYNNYEYLVAASEYQRYMNYYPRDPRREEVQYKEALSYLQMSPRYKLDQTDSKKALELFQLFVLRYPESEFTDEAADKINLIRNKLAHKDLDAAEFYLKIGEYKAAALYFNVTVSKYPESKYSEYALYKAIESNKLYADNSVDDKQVERYRMALDDYRKYLQLFPNGENRAKVEELQDEIRNQIDTLTLK